MTPVCVREGGRERGREREEGEIQEIGKKSGVSGLSRLAPGYLDLELCNSCPELQTSSAGSLLIAT